jgi:hypothetical protein
MFGSIFRWTGKGHPINHESRIGNRALGSEALREWRKMMRIESSQIISTP